ncbi:MAG: glycosyltransferase [Candidatus Omnitrophota bacterium]|nr:glycosyltransferase [Candidatus Omnitrophota bacterium]
MRGDKLLIRKYHTEAAREVVEIVLPEILSSDSKYAISVAGESGSGKTEVACEIERILRENKIRSVTLHQDDYFRYPPKTNYRMRRKDISLVGRSEVRLSLMNGHIRLFKTPDTAGIPKPLVYYDRDEIKKETLKCKTAKVMILDGTYTTLLKHVDKKVFLSRTYRHTLRARQLRKRDKIDDFDKKILAIEHRIISGHREPADLVFDDNYSLIASAKHKRPLKRICMLSVHGYVDPKPILGKTDTGGQVTYVLELSKAMAKKGIKVDIYTRKFQGKKRIEKVCRNVRIIRIPCGGKKFIPKERIYPCLDTYVRNMERFIKKKGLKYDILHSHYWDAGYVALKLTEKLDYFFVHTFHSLGAWKKEQMGGDPKAMEKLYNFKLRIKLEKMIFKKAQALVMTSTDMIKRSKKLYNYKGRNFIVLPAGVNTGFFRPLKKGEKNKRIDVPQNYIFWVGRFATNKGLDYLLQAFAEITTKAKDLFLIIGGGSKKPIPEEKRLRKNLTKIINAKKLNNRVFFTRHIKDELMPTYYRRAKFFVLPSKFEPFAMTAAEAMACGTPLIVSRRAGITKYLKNKHNCLVVNPTNKKVLSWSLRVLNHNWTFRRKIAKNGLKLARKKFSWIKIAERSLDFYEDLLKDRWSELISNN